MTELLRVKKHRGKEPGENVKEKMLELIQSTSYGAANYFPLFLQVPESKIRNER
jgi:hypothetical protein